MEIFMPSGFKGKDIIYHYTSATTAIQHILFTDRLRLSPRSRVHDPIEKVGFSPGGMSTQIDDDQIFSRTDAAAKFIEAEVEKMVKRAKQLCFCENKYGRKFQLDHYGFLKPRMWDQYGDHYKGVCLAYSRSTLLTNNTISHSGKVKYIDYSTLGQNFDTINHDSLDKIGKERYLRNIMPGVKRTFFQKHKDYRDENEYRFVSFSSDKFDLINTKDALVGIIFSPKLINRYSYDRLRLYAKEKDADCIFLDWSKNGVSVVSEKSANEI